MVSTVYVLGRGILDNPWLKISTKPTARTVARKHPHMPAHTHIVRAYACLCVFLFFQWRTLTLNVLSAIANKCRACSKTRALTRRTTTHTGPLIQYPGPASQTSVLLIHVRFTLTLTHTHAHTLSVSLSLSLFH